ncbi:MAG: hypothetical protein KME23_05950 [Goleter apudmare HA4340-LM2]|jgi:predicted transposase YdaD|nr:hypothetical protein [Goleter apudmare HA4340-LM2]
MEIVTSWELEGRRKGRQEAQEEIARNLLREGLTVERVQQLHKKVWE